MLPSSLDVLFALGNNAASDLLKPELEHYKYSLNLSGLRYLIDGYDNEFWEQSFYNRWLNTIKTLNAPTIGEREKYPEFMKTAAWWQQKMNTQLASWAQLRHDNLLYAKQSYSGSFGCSNPDAFLEPMPEFYKVLSDLSKFTIKKLENFLLTDSGQNSNDYFNKKIILYIGHLYEWKGAQDLVEAAALLDGNYLTVFVGGVDSDVTIFKEKNKALIENGKIVVYRHQPREAMPRWLKAADILVLPNKSREKISSHFTSPLKLFEYMASQRPIVASDLPSIREILNEKNCLFFKSDNAKDLVAKIIFLSEHQEIMDQIAKQAYLDVQNYDWGKRAKNIIKFIVGN